MFASKIIFYGLAGHKNSPCGEDSGPRAVGCPYLAYIVHPAKCIWASVCFQQDAAYTHGRRENLLVGV